MYCQVEIIKLMVCWHVFAYLRVIDAQSVTVYSKHNFYGAEQTVGVSKCTNLSPKLAGQVKSVQVKEKCAQLFEEVDCQGWSIEILPRSPSHNNLKPWNFANKAKSVGPCRQPCSPETTGVLNERESKEFDMFDRKDYKGAQEILNVQGCTRIPSRFIKHLASVDTNNTCFQLYSNVRCEAVGRNEDSIELRAGTPFHNDIISESGWNFPQARAVSHCGFNCGKRKWRTTSVSIPVLKGKEVLIFDGQCFQGHNIRIVLAEHKCHTLEQLWQGEVQSINTSRTGCVLLYDRIRCRGKSSAPIAVAAESMPRGFEGVVRSLRLCSDLNISLSASPHQQQTPFCTNLLTPLKTGLFSPVVIIAGILAVVILALFSALITLREKDISRTDQVEFPNVHFAQQDT